MFTLLLAIANLYIISVVRVKCEEKVKKLNSITAGNPSNNSQNTQTSISQSQKTYNPHNIDNYVAIEQFYHD